MQIKKTSHLALLGRFGSNACGIRDYLQLLGTALEEQNCKINIFEFNWQTQGWINSFFKLIKEIKKSDYKAVVIQYTALSWSQRGLPFSLFPIIFFLKLNKIKVGIYFHDPDCAPYYNSLQKIRSALQSMIMKLLYFYSDATLIAIEPKCVSWIPNNKNKAFLVPIGPNVPEMPINILPQGSNRICVFCVTKGFLMPAEVQQITEIVLPLSKTHDNLELIICGNGALESKNEFLSKLENSKIKLTVIGETSLENIAKLLNSAKAMLFVRGPLTGARGSALAGIAAKIPIIGYQSKLTSAPLTEGGILLAEKNNSSLLSSNLNAVLSDDLLYQDLIRKNEDVYKEFFSWKKIAKKYMSVFS